MIGETIQNTNPNTEFPTGSLDGFLSEMAQNKQDMGISETFIDTEPDDEMPNLPDEPSPEIQVKTAPAKATARLITTVIDNTIPAAFGAIAKGNSSKYKASDDEREELTEALTEYVKLNGGDIPPSFMVLILIVTIYGSKVPMMLQQRKLNTEREELEIRKNILEARERDLYEREKKLRVQPAPAEQPKTENNE